MQDLVTYLHADGLLTRSETLAIKRAARDLRENPVRIIRSLNVASPEDIQHCFKVYFNHSLVTDALVDTLTSEYAALMPVDIAVNYCVFAFGEDAGKLHVALEDPTDKRTLAALRFFLGRDIIPSAANVYQLVKALGKLYGVTPAGSRLQTVLDRARGSGAWSISEKELFARILEERRIREEEMARTVSLVMENRSRRKSSSTAKPKSQKNTSDPSPKEASASENAGQQNTESVPEKMPVPDFDVAPQNESPQSVQDESPEALLAMFEAEALPELGDDDFEIEPKPQISISAGGEVDSVSAKSIPQTELDTGTFDGLGPSSGLSSMQDSGQELLDGDLPLDGDLIAESGAFLEEESSTRSISEPDMGLSAGSDLGEDLELSGESEIGENLSIGDAFDRGQSSENELSAASEDLNDNFMADMDAPSSPEIMDSLISADGESTEDTHELLNSPLEDSLELSSMDSDSQQLERDELSQSSSDLEDPFDSQNSEESQHFSDDHFSLESLGDDGLEEPDSGAAVTGSSENRPKVSQAPSASQVLSLSQKAFVKVALAADLNSALAHCQDVFRDVGIDFVVSDLGGIQVLWNGQFLNKSELAGVPWSAMSGLLRELGRKSESKI